jgi:hypothetical protein
MPISLKQIADEAALALGIEHHDADAGQRDRHGDPGPQPDPLTHQQPGEQAGKERRRGLDEQDVGDCRVLEREDEATRRCRKTATNHHTAPAEIAERLDHAAAMADRHVDQEGYESKA